ncbi:phosphoribosylamine--glycine ligase [Flavisolibacter ginsengisoli]|jgi:phosphoribosylamine--glycine ligase|uniref:Phosphoribosylamine--glycine ligase n=1 Tax=Flavisolibacter ginsengisoli DSM 18119 TaxID=1121884 RepID=A0A1M4VSG3_9BACT|nr:phosphoribosylamine--glycine ligase [Flavisolibacter ginsengisoli]SHE71752.1 phosphoribosylamine--glycine ligase [Flavisolibacter ginsengisoli DSM 18119]
MNILLLGSGGREHALAWKLRQSSLCSDLFIAPGNAGTAQCGINLPFAATDFEAVKSCCVDHYIDMVIVGPEEPLVKGIVDYLVKESGLNLLIIGPSKEAAQLEGSKAYAKAFMERHNIPTAAYKEFTSENFEEGIEYLKEHPLPIVLKADGLAAGKGVIICQNHVEAVSEFELMIQRSKFGEAGKRVVVEEFLKGIELSVFVLTDGKEYILLPEAKDYKRIGEGDTGLNTGGMGAISPVPFADEPFMRKVIERVVQPTIMGLNKDDLDYKGFVFIGLMKVGDDPFVIEYNCRMGDPETEVVIPRIKNDLVELFTATAHGQLQNIILGQDERFATTIVAVSGGYPEDYQKGFIIEGLNTIISDTILFHSGTKEVDGTIVTNGGRVLCATALASELEEAINKSRELIEAIEYTDKYYRRDIGFEFLDTTTESYQDE